MNKQPIIRRGHFGSDAIPYIIVACEDTASTAT